MSALRFWLGACAALTLAGWVLSVLHCFNAAGYLVVLAGLSAAGVWHWRKAPRRRLRMPRVRLRGLRALRTAFWLLCALTVLAALFHPLSTWDTLAYRLPRVCHWLAAGSWHWVHAPREWLNNRSPGYEFLMAPGIALHAYRFLWLPNFIAFTFLPGLAFAVLRQLGTPMRAAYSWAFLLPTAHVFLLQAGSTSNDMIGLFFLLASTHFALRFRAAGALADFAWSTVGMGLLTGLKLTNLPLAAVSFVLIASAWPQLRRLKPLAVAAVLIIAAACSGLPIMALNQVRYGDWSGLRGEPDLNATELKYALLGNSILIAAQNLAPPVLPNPRTPNELLLRRLAPETREALDRNFEGSFELWLSEVPNEGRSGLGVTIVVLFACVLFCAWRAKPGTMSASQHTAARLILLAGLVASLAYLAKAGATTAARLAAVHHAAVIVGAVPLLHSRAPQIARRRWWLRLCQAHALICLGAVVAHPFRPLLPVRLLLAPLPPAIRDAPFARRVVDAFEVVPGHLYAYDPLKAYVPPETRSVSAIMRYFDAEGPLWVRFGLHRLTHILNDADLHALRSRHGEVVITLPPAVQERFGMSIPQFAAAVDAEILGSAGFQVSHSEHANEWFVLRVRDRR